MPGVVHHEMLQSQVEVALPPSSDVADQRRYLLQSRAALGAIAASHGLLVHASGTHPLAVWSQQRLTDASRYGRLMHELQMLGARNMVCGMHVHVAMPDPDRRVDVMVRMLPFIPLLLALSTASPFWQSRRTGLMGYRLAAYDELPRTGIPELFASQADYQHYVDTLVAARAITDASYIWWAIRPSLKHPTLELRVADSCARAEDVLGIASLYRALVRHLDRNPQVNAGMTAASRAIIIENKWRAQRFGIHGSFVDEREGGLVSVADALEHAIALSNDDAWALGCTEEIAGLRRILREGTSADVQLALHSEAKSRGVSIAASLLPVVDWLASTTMGTDTGEMPSAA